MKLRNLQALAVAGGWAWAVLFALYGARRWMCGVPWAEGCLAEFGRQTEAAVLLLWVSERETLLGAALALLGGFLLYRQIRQERDFEHQRLERRYRAARAVTPLALNAVIDWAETMIHQWVLAGRRVDQSMFDEIFPVAPGGPTAPTVFDIVFPRLDRSVVRDLQGMIEATFADKDASPFVALLQRIQIMESRSQGFHAKLNSPRTVEVLVGPYCFGQAAECAEVHARAKTLFRFARNDEATKSSEVTLTEIQESLYLAKAYEGSNPEVFEAAERAFGPG